METKKNVRSRIRHNMIMRNMHVSSMENYSISVFSLKLYFINYFKERDKSTSTGSSLESHLSVQLSYEIGLKHTAWHFSWAKTPFKYWQTHLVKSTTFGLGSALTRLKHVLHEDVFHHNNLIDCYLISRWHGFEFIQRIYFHLNTVESTIPWSVFSKEYHISNTNPASDGKFRWR